jgi:hypothetical protein
MCITSIQAQYIYNYTHWTEIYAADGEILEAHSYGMTIPETFLVQFGRNICYIFVFTDLELSYESVEGLHVFVPHKTHFQS